MSGSIASSGKPTTVPIGLFSRTSTVTSPRSGRSFTSRMETVMSAVADMPPPSVTVTVTVYSSVVS